MISVRDSDSHIIGEGVEDGIDKNIKDVVIKVDGERKNYDENSCNYLKVKCEHILFNSKKEQEGWIDYNIIDQEKLFSAYDWRKFDFIFTKDHGDEFMYEIKDVNYAKETKGKLMRDLVELFDLNNSSILDNQELNLAYGTIETQNMISKLVCKHKNEWSYSLGQIQKEIEEFYNNQINNYDSKKINLSKLRKEKKEALKGIKQKVKDLMFWEEAKALPVSFPESDSNKNNQEKERRKKVSSANFLPSNQSVISPLTGEKFSFSESKPQSPPVVSSEVKPSPKLSLIEEGDKITAAAEENINPPKEEENPRPKRMFPSDTVYHFHPIAFVNHMIKIFGSGGDCESLVWGNKVSCEFRRRVVEISKRLECDPNHLMAIIALESDKIFRADRRRKGSQYVGLIQIGNLAADDINRRKKTKITPNHLAYMSAEQQLKYVEYYLEPKKGMLNTLADFYLAVLWTDVVGHGNEPNYVVFDDDAIGDKKKGYWDNKKFLKEEGEVTKGADGKKKYGKEGGKTYVWEIKGEIEAVYEEGLKHKNNCNSGSCTSRNLKEKCPDCNQMHYDVRDFIHFQSQAINSTNCGTICRYIIEEIPGLSCQGTTKAGFAVDYQLAEENSANNDFVYNIEKSKEAIKYIDLALSNNVPLRAGVSHTFGRSTNEGTTDHYVVIVGKTCINGEIYYQYWDVGTLRGSQEKYRFKLVDGYKLINEDANAGKGKDGRKFTVTQIAKATKRDRFTLFELKEKK